MLRAFLIDDVRLYRDALVEQLGRQGSVGIVAAFSHYDNDVLAQIPELRPDIIAIRATAPASLATIKELACASPGVKVIALAVSEAEDEIVSCLEAGAVGYVPLQASLDDLIAIMESAVRGEILCPPRIAGALSKRLSSLASTATLAGTHVHLTPRELEILRLIDGGLSNKEIARSLSIDIHTVKCHVHNILEKLQVHRRAEAATKMRQVVRWRAKEQT